MKKLLKSRLFSSFLTLVMILGLITVQTKEVKAETEDQIVTSEANIEEENDQATLEKGSVDITILHTNDTHGRVKADSSVIGIDTISAIKKSINNSILVDVGDTLHGLPFATMNKGEDIIALMKLAGYDVMTPGNHDFNYGYERLLELANMASTGVNSFPIISANVIKDNITLLDANYIKEVDGVKLGFFGLTTPETAFKTNPNNVKGLEFASPIESAKKQVEELKAKGADIIVALAHIGTDESSEIVSTMIAKEVEGIDIIIDGHSHSNYPTGFEADNGTLIVSTGEYGANLGQVIITFNKDTNKITNKIASLIPKATAATLNPDEIVAQKIEEINEAQNAVLSKVVGVSKVVLDGARENVRTGETNLGNLITDAMLYVTGAEIAITNGGGIRATINAGEITKQDVVSVLPFGNFIVTKYLTGAQIKDILEHGVKDYPATAGHFPHVAGINFVFDAEKAPGERIVSIKINGKDIDMDAKYLVAANDFMAAGGDDYPHFKDVKTENEFQALDEALEEYIKYLGEVNYSKEDRIVVGKAENPVENPEEPFNKAYKNYFFLYAFFMSKNDIF
ncbi:bifunctional metallophosphatase/5'-nucleotidase [Caproiciproducens sp. MSJ-32]|uniref:bifunctional metallophosphatase/5'-nucleotidase n=1 Tax=Caproiciproducens sp. MSJ-32 TaxID=2841527 RepID=UPI001C110F38|nr:5'-nucleotidase C-terminal domain-containing protein [Caproiciproducens sp. MSJ-32]MBU5454203.1 5'-nucleotidase C-terminal domain-containing protein [Caproiciproducens sp. MSJ-32]